MVVYIHLQTKSCPEDEEKNSNGDDDGLLSSNFYSWYIDTDFLRQLIIDVERFTQPNV